MIILCNFCQHPGLLAHLESVIKRAIFYCRNIWVTYWHSIQFMKLNNFSKLADPGKIVQTGISAGSRNSTSFAWVKNILSNHLSEGFISNLDRESSHIFSLFWMLIQKRLPAEISEDLVTWLTETGIHRMNNNVVLGWRDDHGEIELDVGSNLFTFHNAEYAPPTGMMSANYSRYFFVCLFLLTDCRDMFTGRLSSLTSLQFHGQYPGLWLIIKEATSTMLLME